MVGGGRPEDGVGRWILAQLNLSPPSLYIYIYLFLSLDSLSSSSSSLLGSGRALGISWISRRLCSVDWSAPIWCCCWLSQLVVKPPSSWDRLDGLRQAAADQSKVKCEIWRKGVSILTGLSDFAYQPRATPVAGAETLTSFSCTRRHQPCWLTKPWWLAQKGYAGGRVTYLQWQKYTKIKNFELMLTFLISKAI